MKVVKLNEKHIQDLLNLAKDKYPVNEFVLKRLCTGEPILYPKTQVYGIYENNEIVAMATATFTYTFPDFTNAPHGKVVFISAVHSKENMKQEDRDLYESTLIAFIKQEAKDEFGADYTTVIY